jgi:hypothetical protein
VSDDAVLVDELLGQLGVAGHGERVEPADGMVFRHAFGGLDAVVAVALRHVPQNVLGYCSLAVARRAVKHHRVAEVYVHKRPDDGFILALDLACLDDLDYVVALEQNHGIFLNFTYTYS